MKKRLMLKTLNRELQEKYPGIEVVKDNGFFYLYSDDKELGLKIAGLYQSSIYAYGINQMSLEDWKIVIDKLFNDPKNV